MPWRNPGSHSVRDKVVAQMMPVRDAVRDGYAELLAIRQELYDWWVAMGPKLKPDNTDRSQRVRLLSDTLRPVTTPSLATAPDGSGSVWPSLNFFLTISPLHDNDAPAARLGHHFIQILCTIRQRDSLTQLVI